MGRRRAARGVGEHPGAWSLPFITLCSILVCGCAVGKEGSAAGSGANGNGNQGTGSVMGMGTGGSEGMGGAGANDGTGANAGSGGADDTGTGGADDTGTGDDGAGGQDGTAGDDGTGGTPPGDDCPDDPNKAAPGECGCGTPDSDGDGDGVPNCKDECPEHKNQTVKEACGCDADDDMDGYINCADACPNDPKKYALDDGCTCSDDLDTDGDGTLDCAEICWDDVNKLDPGECGCGKPDLGDPDNDGEACNDLCPYNSDTTGPCPAKQITVESDFVDCALSNFPTLVRITGDDDLKTARDDGRDVFFTTTETGASADLDFEIESWDRAAGNLTAWVRLPSISSTQDTVFYLQFAGGTSDDESNPDGLWVDYAAVYHMDYGGGAGTELDSTANGNDIVPYYASSQPRDAAGQIGRGLDFSDPGDLLTTYPDPTSGLDMSSSVTMSVWMKLQANGAPYRYESILAKRYWWESGLGTTSNYEIAIDDADALNRRDLIFYDGVVDDLNRDLIPLEGDWVHLTVVVSGGTCTVYEDGVQTSSVGGCNLTPNDGPLYVGGYDGTALAYDEPLYGVLDEVRISSAARSACWIRADFESQRSGSTFVRISN